MLSRVCQAFALAPVELRNNPYLDGEGDGLDGDLGGVDPGGGGDGGDQIRLGVGVVCFDAA